MHTILDDFAPLPDLIKCNFRPTNQKDMARCKCLDIDKIITTTNYNQVKSGNLV